MQPLCAAPIDAVGDRVGLGRDDQRREVVEVQAARVLKPANLRLDLKRTAAHAQTPVAGIGNVGEGTGARNDLHVMRYA